MSTGLIVTRAGGSSDLGTVVAAQLSSQKRALQIAGGAALALCLVPGLPKLPFLLVGGGLLLLAQRMAAAAKTEAAAEPDTAPRPPCRRTAPRRSSATWRWTRWSWRCPRT